MPKATKTELLSRISELEEQNANLRRLERTIERNLDMFEALVGAMSEAIALTRADGTIIHVVRGVLGYPPNLLTGMPIETVVFLDDRHLIHESYRQIRAGGVQKIAHELRFIKPDGSLLWVELTLTDMLDNPSIMAVISVARDLSWKRRQDLTAPQLATLIDHTSVALFTTGLEGSIEGWHATTAKAFGYEAHEVAGHPVRMLLNPDFEDRERSARSTVIATGQRSARTRAVILAKNGAPVAVDLVLAPLICGGAIRGVAYLAEPIAVSSEDAIAAA